MISIIICSVDEVRFAAVRDHYQRILSGESMEIIRIADARSMCEGYNRGIRQSCGDILILSHDDVEFIAPDFRDRLLSRVRRFDLVGICGADRLIGPQWIGAGPPHIFGQTAIVNSRENVYDVLLWGAPARCVAGMKVMDGVFLAGRREVFEKIPFDEQSFTGFHLYDLDFTFRAYQAGYSLAIINDLGCIHASAGDFGASWQDYASVFQAKYQSQFEPLPPRQWSAALVKVTTKADALEVMTPSYWSNSPEDILLATLRSSPSGPVSRH
jgi:hypothetical protein